MGLASTLNNLADVIDPTLSYWEVVLTTGKRWSERSLVGTLQKGQAGFRKLDWSHDIVSTKDIRRVKEIVLHCPDGRNAVLETMKFGNYVTDYPPFQFKTNSFNPMLAGTAKIEYQVIGRVLSKDTGACECFIWDYFPKPGEPHLVAFTSNIYNFGAWRDTMMPLTSLEAHLQGFRF